MIIIKTSDGGLIIRGPRNLGDKIQKSRPLSDREGQILSRGGLNKGISSRFSTKISQITKGWD